LIPYSFNTRHPLGLNIIWFILNSISMKTICFLPLLLVQMVVTAQVDSTNNESVQLSTYELMRKNATTLKLVGGVSTGVGIGLLLIAGTKVATETMGIFLLQEPDYNQGKTEGTIGTILLIGGVGLYIAGGVKSSKAKKMLAAGEISFYPGAPPAFVAPKASLNQLGFTYRMSLFSGK
jgi:hypothetical protein